MYDFENEIRNEKASREAKIMISKMISEILLKSDAPEHIKMSVRVIDAAQELQDTLHDMVNPMAGDNSENLNIDNAKKFCLLLTATNEQIKAFAYASPLIESTEANNENI